MRGSLGWTCHDRVGDHVPSNCEHGPRTLLCKVRFKRRENRKTDDRRDKEEECKRAENRGSVRRRWLDRINNRYGIGVSKRSRLKLQIIDFIDVIAN